MPRERRGIDFSALADVPGALPKPRAKRDKAEGRSTPGSSLRTYSTLKASTAPMAHNARPEDVDGAQSEAARLIRVCCCCGREGATHPHHEPPVSLGGLDHDVVPLAPLCHSRRHALGACRFWREAQIDPETAKEALQAWMAAGYPQSGKPWGR